MASLLSSLSVLETSLSITLFSLSNHLSNLSTLFSNLATYLSNHPFSTVSPNLPTPSTPIQYFLSAVLLLPPLPFMLSYMFKFFYNPPLQTVPPPAHTFDPYIDPQSDEFPDEDACPQLAPGIDCLNPATGALIASVPDHTPADVAPIVKKARAAAETWKLTTFKQRRKVLQTIRDYILYNQGSIVDIAVVDTGKTKLEAYLGEIVPTLEKLRWLIAEGESALKPSRRNVGPMTLHKSAAVEYMPLGVIAAIAPWNYPIHNFLNPVLAAIFAGNGVVVKPSEETLYSSIHIARIVRRALKLCGHDPELVQCLIGRGDVGEALVKSDVDKVFFTGSTTVGKLVAKTAAEKLTPTCLELGGKDAFIVCDDANISHAAGICARGVFQNAGQNCIGVERVFVQTGAKDTFLEAVLTYVKNIRLGEDMGALTLGERAIHKIEELIQDAKNKGAKIITGGSRTSVRGVGAYFEPTVIVGVTSSMRIAQEEVFGPVLVMFDFLNDKELIDLVNDCPFGLGSSVFSTPQRANKILAQLRVGMGNVNDFATNYLCQSMPFGGTKMSGSDRFAGIEGLRGCCVPKSITRDRFWGVKTTIPKAFNYPTAPNAPEMAAEINDLMYSSGWISKLDNFRNLVGMILFPSWRPRSTGSG